eukprot:m.36261 g.36261  ORF g.36261 m.36261 type:complete len:361 (+) comp7549_c0_seq1:173-1255(+)
MGPFGQTMLLAVESIWCSSLHTARLFADVATPGWSTRPSCSWPFHHPTDLKREQLAQHRVAVVQHRSPGFDPLKRLGITVIGPWAARSDATCAPCITQRNKEAGSHSKRHVKDKLLWRVLPLSRMPLVKLCLCKLPQCCWHHIGGKIHSTELLEFEQHYPRVKVPLTLTTHFPRRHCVRVERRLGLSGECPAWVGLTELGELTVEVEHRLLYHGVGVKDHSLCNAVWEGVDSPQLPKIPEPLLSAWRQPLFLQRSCPRPQAVHSHLNVVHREPPRVWDPLERMPGQCHPSSVSKDTEPNPPGERGVATSRAYPRRVDHRRRQHPQPPRLCGPSLALPRCRAFWGVGRGFRSAHHHHHCVV